MSLLNINVCVLLPIGSGTRTPEASRNELLCRSWPGKTDPVSIDLETLFIVFTAPSGLPLFIDIEWVSLLAVVYHDARIAECK